MIGGERLEGELELAARDLAMTLKTTGPAPLLVRRPGRGVWCLRPRGRRRPHVARLHVGRLQQLAEPFELGGARQDPGEVPPAPAADLVRLAVSVYDASPPIALQGIRTTCTGPKRFFRTCSAR